uniref:LAGLIDADG endonuclease n=1 Tax=Pyronema omphalodes TaxID=337075 RepID=A0A140IMX1_9PEZI|nr:LAGLIDADG endonuclease [Pyronema omphalodes]AMO66529.1 LAGLIDADG endonuclease [Pyronema omphalodes]
MKNNNILSTFPILILPILILSYGYFLLCLLLNINRIYTTLWEWISDSPPTPYSFVSLPLQSSVVDVTPQQTSPDGFPYFVTGFADGEATFGVYFTKAEGRKFGYIVRLYFGITLHRKDRRLLERVKNYFNVGTIFENDREVAYKVVRTEDIATIIKHFDKYPLVTQKLADYLLFKQAFLIIQNKDHLTIEGFTKLIAIRASINTGSSDAFKALFPGVNPYEKPVIKDAQIPDPYWLAGFVSAEGCLSVYIYKAETRTGFNVQVRVQITQHPRDMELLKRIIPYLGCGRFVQATRGDCNYVVSSILDICTKVIPFFDKYCIEGVKALDYADFKKAVEIVYAKGHLTEEGLEAIRKIKAGMNTGRSIQKIREAKLGEKNPMYGKTKSPEFLAMQTRDKSGAHNPMYGKPKSEETLTKLRKLVYVYNASDGSLEGTYSTGECLKTFKIGYGTLYKRLEDGEARGGLIYSREPKE